MKKLLHCLLLAAGLALALTARAADPPKVSNVFADSDIQSVLGEIASATGSSILADSSVKGIAISLELKDDTVEGALEKIALITGLYWKRRDNSYLVSAATPEAPLFAEFAQTRLYRPRTLPAESLFSLLTRSFQTFAQMDKEANLITITAPSRQLKLIWDALTEADRPGRQFVVEALVTEMSTELMRESGFSWSWRYFAQGDGLGLAASAAKVEDIVRMKQMITEKKASLRASPRVLATEGKEAMLTVGTETYVKLASEDYGGMRGSQYQRINTGISLKFIGFLEEDGAMNLHLMPEVSDAISSHDGNPATTVRRMNTYLRVRPGETVALGGLIQASEVRRDSRTPILGSLPLIGPLFRSTKREKKETEVVILITPRLVDQAAPTLGESRRG